MLLGSFPVAGGYGANKAVYRQKYQVMPFRLFSLVILVLTLVTIKTYIR
jgi:hypothetical protein